MAVVLLLDQTFSIIHSLLLANYYILNIYTGELSMNLEQGEYDDYFKGSRWDDCSDCGGGC